MNRSFAWIFGVLALQRAIELGISGRNRRILEKSGGRERDGDSFQYIAVLHGSFFLSLLYESYPWRLPVDARTALCLAVLVLLSGIRYWCIASLGSSWNVRIIVVPGRAPIRRGPYRYLKHPNYLVVALEFLFLPLLLRAPVTLVAFSLLNALVLLERIGLENEALRENAEPGGDSTAMRGSPKKVDIDRGHGINIHR